MLRRLLPALTLGLTLAAVGAPLAEAAAPARTQVLAAPAPVEAATADGLVVRADLRDVYVTGFPVLVEITVSNPTREARSFPDLAARPWLVGFAFTTGTRRTERTNTPPAQDPGGSWTLAPGGERRVLLEIPASSRLTGASSVVVAIAGAAAPAAAPPASPAPAGGAPDTRLRLPARELRFQPARPVAGHALSDPTVRSRTGDVIPWVQALPGGGFELLALQMAPKHPDTPHALRPLLRLSRKVEPALSRGRAADAGARWLYWQDGDGRWTVGRLEAGQLRDGVRTVAVPYAAATVLARGVTDGRGGLLLPLWVPDPAGSGGSVQVLDVDPQGGSTTRQVVSLPARPLVAATGVDATGNLLLAVGHAAAVDLYKVDPTAPREIGARGVRLQATTGGLAPAALAFDTVPDRGSRAGGLALVLVEAGKVGATATGRTRWYDLGGKILEDGPVGPWTVPGTIQDLLPDGYGAWRALSRDKAGALWVTAQAGKPARVSAPTDGSALVPDSSGFGVLWPTKSEVRLRTLAPDTVVRDVVVGPRE